MPRHLENEPLDPNIAAELADLEAALAGSVSASPELTALVADVREQAKSPSVAFRTELDARVAAGFDAGGGARRWLTALAARRNVLLPAMGVATTLIVALVVVNASMKDGGGNPQVLSRGVAQSTAGTAQPTKPPAVPAPSAGYESAGGAASVAAAPQLDQRAAKSAAPGPGFGRKVQHTTTMALSTSPGKLQDTADGVVRVTQQAGGVVQRSEVNTADGGGSASFTLSVPTARLDDTIAQLSKLAHVSSMSQAATDITKSFVSTAARLSDARAERKALLKALGKATTAVQIEALKSRLAYNRSQIAAYDGQLKALRRRADNTTVNLGIEADGSGAVVTPGGWSFSDAPGDALHVLEIVATVILISAAILGPLALLGALALFTLRAGGRRRREHALDAR